MNIFTEKTIGKTISWEMLPQQLFNTALKSKIFYIEDIYQNMEECRMTKKLSAILLLMTILMACTIAVPINASSIVSEYRPVKQSLEKVLNHLNNIKNQFNDIFNKPYTASLLDWIIFLIQLIIYVLSVGTIVGIVLDILVILWMAILFIIDTILLIIHG